MEFHTKIPWKYVAANGETGSSSDSVAFQGHDISAIKQKDLTKKPETLTHS